MKDRWTYWDEELGSFILKDQDNEISRWDLINKIGELEEELNKVKNGIN